MLEIIIESKNQNDIEGVTFIGGEPSLQKGLHILALELRKINLGTIMFSGHYLKELSKELINTMDIIIDGPFIASKLDNPEVHITKIGKFLRKTSLDEIPQAFNIFIGQMSVVGPRPALWNQDDLIVERDRYNANDIKPGLSGWAQCNGRDRLSIDEKAKLDGEYVKRFNIWFDIRIIFKTVFQAFRDKDEVEGNTNDK